MKKHISDISTKELTEIGQQASLKAREKALQSGSVVISTDDTGQLIAEQKNEDGTVSRQLIDESVDK